MSGNISADPFSSRNILKLPLIVDNLAETWHGFQLDDKLQSESLRLADIEKVGLPDLKPDTLRLSLDATSLEQIDATESTGSYKDLGDTRTSDEPDALAFDNLWELAGSSENASKNFLASWEQFINNGGGESDVKLFSEAGLPVTDIVNVNIWQSLERRPLRYAKPDQLQHALINLILGHDSAFFKWDHSSTSFRHLVDNYALPGHTCEIIKNTCKLFENCGSSFRRINNLCQPSSDQRPTSYAIRSSILKVLHAIESDLVGRSPRGLTLIRLTQVAQVYVEILTHIEGFLLSMSTQSNEAEVLTATVHSINDSWISKPHLRVLMTRLASRILRPAVSATEEQLGLSVIQPTADATQDWLFSELMPSQHGKFLETIECLSAVQMHAPRVAPILTQPAKIEIVQQWMDIVGAQQTANELEQQAIKALSWQMTPYVKAQASSLTAETAALTSDPFAVNFSLELVQASRMKFLDEHNSVITAIAAVFEPLETDIALGLSPLQALEHSVAPFLEVQHRISSYALMKTLFLEHDLVAHLDRLHAFQLLGNGLFAARLSRALFDAEQNSAEGRRKTGLTAGLRLEDREVWPPASSELRLVLRDLLSESSTDRRPNDVVESLSFAIRELSDAELELCRDLHSIYALDFLRLTYAPPNPILKLVITSSVLEKYDRIFKFLLVLLRMHSLTQNLITSSSLRSSVNASPIYQKLCIRLHWFISSFIEYAFNVAIKIPWDHFSKTICRVHRHVSNSDYGESLSLAGSIAQLRQLHEDTLDDILKSLLLKRKQAKVYDLACKMFSSILRFTSTSTASMMNQQCKVFYNQHEETMRLWVSQIETIVTSTQDPPLRRLDFLVFKIDGNHFYRADDG
ncbi:hypothetical protein H2198_003574 [Neophaeococcomyces mojaviensis]|uniref:Uncharacterized protein n=1 Tax=Neophaeococcomyces mojaviensis TaxID=3383035 RepID=A0ACC3AB29_9EURO|nr:hypothetical protein H2198_003574 [Knufia sp. JES_112]